MASNPYPLPTPVYRLPTQSADHKENIESSKEPSIADAETVAKSFAQCSVSLSVISPKQLPTLKAIYNAVILSLVLDLNLRLFPFSDSFSSFINLLMYCTNF